MTGRRQRPCPQAVDAGRVVLDRLRRFRQPALRLANRAARDQDDGQLYQSGGCWPLPSTSTTAYQSVVQSLTCTGVLPADVRVAVPLCVVWVPNVVRLKAKRILQVVAWLLLSESHNDGSALGNIHDHQAARFR